MACGGVGQYKNVGGPDDTEQELTDLGQEQAQLVGSRLAELLQVLRFRATRNCVRRERLSGAYTIQI